MTVVIGFNWPMWHDNAAAAIVDGKLVFASEEERYTRHKHSIREPPINALRQTFLYLKKSWEIKPKDVDAFAVNFDPKLFPWKERSLQALAHFCKLGDYGISLNESNRYSYYITILESKVSSCSTLLYIKVIMEYRLMNLTDLIITLLF